MLQWAVTFFVLALVAAFLGLGGIAGMSADIGKLFVVLAVILLIVSLVTGRRSPPVV